MHRILALLLIASPVLADVEITSPLMTLADEDGTPLDLPKSTSEVEAMEKASRLPSGTYKLIRPDATIVVTGREPTPTPQPTPEPTPSPTPQPTPEPTPAPEIGSAYIVYSRVPRTLATAITASGAPREVGHLDVWDSLPEVSRMFSGFNAPGQLVLRDRDGAEKIIYDCHSDWSPCVPFDASVSTDGTKIAFAVYRSDKLVHRNLRASQTLPNWYLGGSGQEAQIYIYDIESEAITAWPHTDGVIDSSPIFLPNGKMVFSSNRDGFRKPFLPRVSNPKSHQPRLYLAEQDGSNPVDISPHEVSGALHPWLLNNGRIAYSSMWLSHNLPYIGNNGSINWPTTMDNMWVLGDMDMGGGDFTALLGSHRNSISAANGRTKTMKALHFIGQRTNDDICIANYYRRNNLGLGDVWCFPPEHRLIEGPATKFLPRGIYNVANYSKSNDEKASANERKIGFPSGDPDGGLLLTVADGWCTTVAYGLNTTPEKIGDRKGCDAGIYLLNNIPSDSLDDLIKIADEPEWHEFNAKAIYPRDIELPELDRGDSCLLASSDAGSTDAHHYGTYKFNKMYRAMANNGGEIYGIDHDELAGIRFYEVIPNPQSITFENVIGNEVRILGDVPLLPDKSFIAELPCDTPFTMAGIDADGRIIKRDQIPMSLRPGEKRTCEGCHLHGERGRPYEQSLAYSAEPFQAITSRPVPTFEADVQPILQESCAGCHAWITDYHAVAQDWNQSQAETKFDTGSGTGSRQYGLQRPALSKYVNSMFARESLLYWKAANQRADGRTDEQYPDDIDFGADHPDTLSSEELKILGDWIDAGSAR